MLPQGNATMTQGVGTGVLYAQRTAAQNAVDAPRELGLMERLDGVASGLEEINRRLTGVCARISGQGETEGKDKATPVGMPATLSYCEQYIRATLSTIESMERTF